MEYLKRSYRDMHRQDDLVHFQVAVRETDLDVAVRKDRFDQHLVDLAERLVNRSRDQLLSYTDDHPEFLKSLSPLDVDPGAPPLVRAMAEAGRAAGVGPMAAVAGAIAETVGRRLLASSRDVIVENGGDIYMRTSRHRIIGIFAGRSPLNGRFAISVRPTDSPLGICTSSGTVGHSLSFGCADAVVVLSPSAALADAAATAAGNIVRCAGDLELAVDFALSIQGVSGAMAILGDRMAARGRLKIVPAG